MTMIIILHSDPSIVKPNATGVHNRYTVANSHRSHFGSRYKSGCCGHAGLFERVRVSLINFIRAVECYPEGCAAPGRVLCQCNTRGPLSKLERTPPRKKIHVTSKSPVGGISVVTLIRTDTTLDHSQKAEKV
jgi:hypothetical protein